VAAAVSGQTHPGDPGEPSSGVPRISVAAQEADILAGMAAGLCVLEIGTAGMSTVLATIALGNPAAAAASGAVLTLAGFPRSDSSADNTGTAAAAGGFDALAETQPLDLDDDSGSERRGDGLGAARSDAIEGEAERAQRAIVLEAQAERQRAVVANLCRKAVQDTRLFSKQMSADA
jgi:hypothetical protein